MHAVEGLAVGFHDEVILETFDYVADFFEHDEVIVGDGIDECVREEIGAEFANSGFVGADTVADSVEDIAGILLESDDRIGVENDAQVFACGLIGFLIEAEHVQSDIDIIVEVLDFEPPLDVEDILHGEGMHIKMGAEFLDNRRVVDAININPCGRWGIFESEAIVGIGGCEFISVMLVVVDYGNRDRFGFFLDYGDKRSGMHSDFFGSVDESFHGCVGDYYSRTSSLIPDPSP